MNIKCSDTFTVFKLQHTCGINTGSDVYYCETGEHPSLDQNPQTCEAVLEMTQLNIMSCSDIITTMFTPENPQIYSNSGDEMLRRIKPESQQTDSGSGSGSLSSW